MYIEKIYIDLHPIMFKRFFIMMIYYLQFKTFLPSDFLL